MSGDRVFTETDNGSSVRVTPGDVIRVRLAENATTGYRWSVDATLPPCVKQTGESHDPASSDAAGAGGVAAFAFEVTGQGSGVLAFEQRRSWEAVPLETFRLDLAVAAGT